MADKIYEAIALCRVSTAEQENNGSLKRQNKSVTETAERLGVKLVKIWSGSVSSKKGNNRKRKDLQEMLAYCKTHKNVKYLLIDEPDRFMRSFEEAGHYIILFRELGVEIRFSDDSLNGDDISAVVARAVKMALAEGDNWSRISKSINGHTNALKEGRYTFQPPIGYMRGKIAGIHEIDPETGPVLRMALISISDGTRTVKQAMDWYNENCPPIRDGRHSKIRMDKWTKFVANPYYAGIIVVDKQIKVRNDGLHKPLITKEQHEKILEALGYRKKMHRGPVKGGNARFPLNQILLCEECAAKNNKVFKFTGYDNNNGKTDKVYSRYFCRGCNKSITRDDAHAQVINVLNRLDFTEEGRRAVTKALEKIWATQEEDLKIELNLDRRELTKLEESEKEYTDQLVKEKSESIKNILRKRIEDIVAQAEEKKNKIQNIERAMKEGRQDFMAFALEYIDNMGQHFFELPLEEVGVCKNILFPSGFWMGPDKIIYTHDISLLYRERTTKMGFLTPKIAIWWVARGSNS